ncbi:MAG: glycosyltransferase family 39 protein [Chloroflexota bacterium]|nr:glycosyltransferase family 39 protein [Chloroflexota bacterium]
MKLSRRARFWVFAGLIALGALVLRVYAIDRLPPGLFGDEAVEGLDALDVLAGNFAIWFHAHLGREPIFVYLVALSYSFFGITPLATRLPAIIAGLLTIPATFFCVREWAAEIFTRDRATRLALLTTALLAISFWHIEMTRNAHRDTLLPLVEAVGYALLWRAIHTRDWRWYAAAGAVLGLAIYTYSPGRFVGVFVAVFVVIELLARWIDARRRTKDGRTTIDADRSASSIGRSSFGGLAVAALLAIVVMLPLGIYFAQNPAQFSRRFASVSIFDFDSPAFVFAQSVIGNLAQFVVPGAGYASKHYNLPGKPVFDLLLAPWFLVGIVIAAARWRKSEYRFLLLWFIVMMTPAFLTADMNPKGVRVLGVVPGVFVFPALAMDWIVETLHATSLRRRVAIALIALCLLGSAAWTAYDYFVAWANLPELPLAFDADLTEVAAFIQRQPADQPIYVSEEVYRPPTLMLLGERVPTSHYVDRATRIREFDARNCVLLREPDARYVFVRDYTAPQSWLDRIVPRAQRIGAGEYFAAFQFGPFNPQQQAVDLTFNPMLKLVGYSRYTDDPSGVALYWLITSLPDDRADTQTTLTLLDAQGAGVAQNQKTWCVPPLDWKLGDGVVEWYAFDAAVGNAVQFSIKQTRGASEWQSPNLALR